VSQGGATRRTQAVVAPIRVTAGCGDASCARECSRLVGRSGAVRRVEQDAIIRWSGLRASRCTERNADAGQLLGHVPEAAGDVHVVGGRGAPDELRCASLLQEPSRPGEAVAGNVGDGRVERVGRAPAFSSWANRRLPMGLVGSLVLIRLRTWRSSWVNLMPFVGDGEVEHGPDEREAAGLAGEAADHLGAAFDLAERPFEQVRGRYERRQASPSSQGSLRVRVASGVVSTVRPSGTGAS
jgi:hypothetical protein